MSGTKIFISLLLASEKFKKFSKNLDFLRFCDVARIFMNEKAIYDKLIKTNEMRVRMENFLFCKFLIRFVNKRNSIGE